ncbi:MAG TPA: glucose-6-phosphate dehydrogenase [Candidatus Saccharimonadales bacterium]
MAKGVLPGTILVVFGITGDLSRRYLLPALSEVCRSANLPENFTILGVSRRDVSIAEVLGDNNKNLKHFTKLFQMDLNAQGDYLALKKKLSAIGQKSGAKPQVIFYLSVPPAAVLPIIRHLGQAGLNHSQAKLLLEKPFGFDLASARELITQTAKHFPEKQVYRIDHYLAKEVAQNIVVFLGSNALFRNVWSHRFIEKIVIIVAEKINIEARALFYESTGALRDVIQSHLLQLAALTLMEPYADVFEYEELPSRRLIALKALSIDIDKPIIRAQYKSYQKEVANPGSTTETFVGLTLKSKERRWQGVPILLASGKNLNDKLTEIRIYFKKKETSEANRLALRVQPKEGIELDLWVKEPGYERRLKQKSLAFTYEQHYERLPDAYERVLLDAIRGSQSLFASSGEVLESWRILEPIQERWRMGSSDLRFYKPGSTIEEVLKLI